MLKFKRKLEGKMVFKRTKAYAWIFIVLFISFVPVVIWLFTSLMYCKGSPDYLLITMAILCLCFDILFLVISIVYFLQKKDAITIKDKKVILKTYKEQVISFDDIKDIRKHCYYFSSKGMAIASQIGLLNSGYIQFTLKDNKKIYVKDIKNVSEVCFTLRGIVLGIKH